MASMAAKGEKQKPTVIRKCPEPDESLATAAFLGDASACLRLLSSGVNGNAWHPNCSVGPHCDDPHCHVLHLAISGGQHQIVKLLIEHAVKVNVIYIFGDEQQKYIAKFFLHYALGKPRIMEILLDAGIYPDYRDPTHGFTALHEAVHLASCGESMEASIAVLLKMRANPFFDNTEGKTPIAMALEAGQAAIATQFEDFLKALPEWERGYLEWEARENGCPYKPFLKSVSFHNHTREVPRQSEEYSDVQCKLAGAMGAAKITLIEKIVNVELQTLFNRQEAALERRVGNTLRTLYHGTTLSSLEGIVENGLDSRLAGTFTGANYGKGIYLAVKPTMARNYAKGVLLVVKALIGKYTVGKKEYTRPPPVEAGKPQLYDCCADRMEDPRFFVLFDNHRVFADYIVYFTGN